MTLKEMLEKRAKLVADMNQTNTEMSVKGLTEARQKELDASWDKMEADEADLSKKIQRSQRLADLEKRGAEKYAEAREQEGGDKSKDLQADYRSAFEAYFKRGNAALTAEQRSILEKRGTATQVVGTNTLGGHLVPEGFQPELIRTMKSYSGIMQVARMLPTDTGNDLPWPTSDNTARKAVLTAEAAAIAVQDKSFGVKTMKAYKYTDLMKVSSELLQDSALDISTLCAEFLGEGFGRAMNDSCTNGDGSSKPTGVVTGSSLGHTAAATNAIAVDEILDLVHSIDPAYRSGNNFGFMFHDQVLKVLKKLKDSDGRRLWKVSEREGAPDTFDGYRYWINQDMESSLAAAKKVMLFGDFSKFVIRNVKAVQIRRADELFLNNDLVGFYGFARWDSQLLDTAAVKHLITAAS